MAEVITQNNLNDVVNAVIANNTIAENVLTGTIRSINKIVDASKIGEKQIKSLNNLEKVIESYSAVVSNVIDILCNSMGNGKDLSTLLGRIREIDEANEKGDSSYFKENTKFTVVEAAMQIPNIVNSMFGVLKKAGEFKMGFKSIFSVRKNMFLLKFAMKELFGDMLNIFKELAADPNIDKIIKSLVKQPDTITNIVKNNINKTGKDTMIDKTRNSTVTKQGQLGLLDVFERVFNILGLLNNIQTPNFIKLEAKLIKMRYALWRVFEHLSGFVDNNMKGNVEESLNTFGILIGGNQNEDKPGLLNTFNKLKEIVDIAVGFNAKIINLIIFNEYGFPTINKTLKNIITLIKDTEKRKSVITHLSDSEIEKKLKRAINNVEQIGELINSLSKFVLQSIIFNFSEKYIIGAIQNLSLVVDSINDVAAKLTGKFLKNKSAIESIDDVLDSLIKINTKLALLGPLSVLGGIGAIILSGMIWALVPLVLSLNAFSNWLNKRNATQINLSIFRFEKILLNILVIGAAITILGILTPSLLKLSLGVLVLIGGFVLMSMFLWLSFKLIGRLSIQTAPNILIFGAVIAMIMFTIIASGALILLAADMADKINTTDSWTKITLMLLGSVALAAAIIGLGILLSVATPIIAPAMFGFGQILILLGLVIGSAFTINNLANAKLETDKAKENVGFIFDFVKDLRSRLIEDKEEIGSKKDWKKSKRLLKKVDKTVKEVVDIAKKLNYLQTIQFDETAIIKNVTKILAFTQKLDDLISRLVFGRNIESDGENKGNWLTRTVGGFFQRGATDRMRKSMKSSKKMLSQVDKVVLKLSDIGETLMSLNDFTLDDTIKQKIETNITNIFTFIQTLDDKINSLNSTGQFKDIIGTTRRDIRQARRQKREYKHNAKTMSKVEAIMVNIASITDSLISIKDFEWNVTDEQLTKKVDIIFKSIDKVSAAITKNNNIPNSAELEKLQPIIDYLCAFSDSTKGIAEANSENLSKNIDNYVRFVDKVNTVDVNKLETSAKMFEQMANFSNSIKGDFDRLAESLGEKLVPVLENLREIMQEIPDKIETSSQNVSASVAATAAPATRENVTAQINRENPNLTTEEVDRIVTARMNEKAKADANGLASKIDELISLFKGYGGEHAVVQTI